MRNLTAATVAIALLASPLMLTSLGVDSSGSAFAAEQSKRSSSKQKTRKVPAMREKTYKTLSEAQVLIEEGAPADAIPVLDKLKARRGLNRYEVAQIWNTLAYAYYSLEDVPNTIKAYKQVLAQEEITEALELNSLRSLFQLYYSEEQYKTALTYIDKWMALNAIPDPATVFLKATCYFQLEDFRNSLIYALQTEKEAIAQAKTVKENWLYLQVVIYNELEDYPAVISVLEKLIVTYPKKQYWMHLAGMYAELEQDNKALSAFYAAYTQNWFTRETEVVMLAQRLLNAEVPFESAMVLSKAMKDGMVEETEKNLRLLGQAWTMAQEMEKAIITWSKASEYAEDGAIFYRLAQALASEDKHKDAVKAYRNALDKGDLKKPYDVSFWLGISLMQLSRWDQAVDAFRVASKDTKKAKQCRRYIRYVKGEKRRQIELRKMEREFSL